MVKKISSPGNANYEYLKKIFRISFPVLMLFSCKNKDAHSSASGPSSQNEAPGNSKTIEQPLLLKLKLPDSATIYYDISNETTTKQEIGDETKETENKLDMGLLYTIKKDTGSNYNLIIRYDKFIAHLKTGDNEKDVDASTAITSENGADRLFAVFKDAMIRAKVSQQGEIKSLSGTKELNDKLYNIANVSPASTVPLGESVKQFLSDAFFKKNVEQTFKIYPAKPVSVGDTWESTDTIQSEIKLPVKTTYKLESIDEGIAVISSTSDIVINQPTQMGNYTADLDFKGTAEGTMKITIASGLLQSEKTNLKLKGTINLLGKEVTISLRINSDIKAR